MDLFEGCQDRRISGALNWLNEPQDWRFSREGLNVTPAKGTDFFRPKNGTARDNAPMLYTPVKGDFTAVTRAEASLVGFGDAAALTLRAGPALWAKICIERSPIGDVSIVSVVTRDFSDDSNNELIPRPEASIRLTRKGNQVGMHYRKGDGPWRFVRTVWLDLPEEICVGVHGQAPYEEGCHATFKSFDIIDTAVEDFRSGD